MATDAVRGKKLRWTFDDGPTAGKTFEHTFHDDGAVSWTEVGTGKGASTEHYEVAEIRDQIYAISYLAESGFTLTSILDFDTRAVIAFASNEKMLIVQHGTFEYADEADWPHPPESARDVTG